MRPGISQILFEIMLYLFSHQSTALAESSWKTWVEQCTDITRMERLIAAEWWYACFFLLLWNNRTRHLVRNMASCRTNHILRLLSFTSSGAIFNGEVILIHSWSLKTGSAHSSLDRDQLASPSGDHQCDQNFTCDQQCSAGYKLHLYEPPYHILINPSPLS